MTDRELIIILMQKINHKIYVNENDCLEVENSHFGENISFDFDNEGNLINIYS